MPPTYLGKDKEIFSPSIVLRQIGSIVKFWTLWDDHRGALGFRLRQIGGKTEKMKRLAPGVVRHIYEITDDAGETDGSTGPDADECSFPDHVFRW